MPYYSKQIGATNLSPFLDCAFLKDTHLYTMDQKYTTGPTTIPQNNLWNCLEHICVGKLFL